jgi:hypothetical protein
LRRNQKNPQKIKVPFQKRCKRSSGCLNEEMEMNGDGAKRLGEKLLMEVEVEDLSSVCDINTRLVCETNNTNINTGVQVHSRVGDSGRRIVRLFLTILNPTIFILAIATHVCLLIPNRANDTNSTKCSYFSIPEIDRLVSNSGTPILELVSPPPTHHASGAGKTSLLYLIIAHAILPRSFSTTPIGGQEAAVVLFDPLHHFSIPRLAETMLSLMRSHLLATEKEIDDTLQADMKSVIKTALPHLHIFRPQSWSSLLSTLDSLPGYLLDPAPQHKSMHRRIHSLVLEDIDAFIWSIRNTSLSVSSNSNTLATASTQLTTSLIGLTKLFSCSTILTSQSTTPSSYRPMLPTSWPQGTPVTRLAVRRVDVLKFAPAISVEDAEKERLQRWDVVSRARFECWRMGVGARDGEGFVFRVGKGIEMERDGGR